VPGLAFIGDAAMASDPLWAGGCGRAFQSAAWLVDATAEALGSKHGLDRALRRSMWDAPARLLESICQFLDRV